MKQFMNYAFLSAIAFAGALGFSSCSDENVVAENNPNNSENDGVHVNFVMNVSTSNEPTTRMSAPNTQAIANQPFRGITNAYLGVFKQSADGKYVSDASAAMTQLYPFGTIIPKNGIGPGASAESHRVVELSLDTDVNSMMFWGKAVKDGTSREQGQMTMNISNDLSATSFSLDKIVPEQATTTEPHVYVEALQQHETLMAYALTVIANSNITNKDVTCNGVTHKITLAWSDYVNVAGDASSGYTITARTVEPNVIKTAVNSANDINISALGEKLAKTYATWNTIRSGELRAGSGSAVARVIEDLMGNINSIVGADPVSWEEEAAQVLAEQIKENVEKFFDVNGEYSWFVAGTVKTASGLGDAVALVEDDCDLNKFPSTFNLPLGSVLLDFSITEKNPGPGFDFAYHYRGQVATYAMGDATGSFNPLNYVYPAELCYFGNSSIRVSNETKAANYYPDGVTNWDTEGSWTNDWVADSHVTNTTRSVAMKYNINYGTALLETKVKYGAGSLEDNYGNLDKLWNNKSEVTEPNNVIDVTADRDHFVLTGVLVGGQEQVVGWNYIAKAATPGFGNMVYDKVGKTGDNGQVEPIQIPYYDGNNPNTTSVANYTLLWDNWEPKNLGKKQRDVYVALEFKNMGRDFYGQNNLIRSGSTFYIVGKLDPDKIPSGMTGYTQTEYEADRSLGITWPDKYALPPYDSDGKTIKERRVFIQDYVTRATFVIGGTSLQHALVSVPDLRSGQISLGLSVDISWRTGLNFGNVILGEQ